MVPEKELISHPEGLGGAEGLLGYCPGMEVCEDFAQRGRVLGEGGIRSQGMGRARGAGGNVVFERAESVF